MRLYHLSTFAFAGIACLAAAAPTAANPYEDAVNADTPLVFYRFEEALTASPAADASGNANNGAYQGTVTLGNASAFANLGSAAGFLNGSPNGAVAVPALGSQSKMSIETWVNPTTTNTFDTVYNTASFPNGALHYQFTTSGQLEFTINQTSGGDDLFFGSFADGQWAHVIATYDSTTGVAEMFVNGQSIGTQTFNGTLALLQPANLAAAHIGAWNGNARQFDGLIDEVSIYATNLNDADALEHYAAATGNLDVAGAGNIGNQQVDNNLNIVDGVSINFEVLDAVTFDTFTVGNIGSDSANATLAGLINLQGIGPEDLAGSLDLFFASGMIDTTGLEITSGFEFAVVPNSAGGQILQVSAVSAAVPEPASVAIWTTLGIAMIGFVVWRRKRRSAV